jgi:hypothetical protein
MESCGFIMLQGKEPTEQEKEDKKFDHINVLEFAAVILKQHLGRGALPDALANSQCSHHHESPRQQHICPVLDATCSQNKKASSTQLSSFSTSFAHSLSFTSLSPGKAPPRKRTHHSRPSVVLLTGPIVGVCYRANIPNA